MPELKAPTAGAEFQYSSPEHQASTAVAGMWLFIADETLFFGGLLYVWLVNQWGHPEGYRRAAEAANLFIGSINTAVLITASLTYTWGLAQVRAGRGRRGWPAFVATAALGALFLALKLQEWHLDLGDGLYPGAAFRPRGADWGGMALFYNFYWIATGLHGIHITVGIGLVLWIAWRVRRGAYPADHTTPVEVVGLDWSFVDVVWLVLYPLIYVVGRV
jgi:cytochrome c oxidase subunit III